MIYNTCSSKEIIGRLFNSYNIKSADFIARTPQWIGEALGKLNIFMTLEPARTRIEVNEYKAKLPSTVKILHAVEYNGNIIPRLEGTRIEYLDVSGLSESYSETKLIKDIVYDSNGNITSVRTTDSTIPLARTSDYDYILNKNGYLDVSFQTGELVIYFYKLPEETDSVTGMYYPLVPDNEYVKEAITWYCLMNMLYRGYKHKVLSIASPNRYLNPATQWDYYMPIARNSAGSPDRAKREAHSEIWRSVVLNVNMFKDSFATKID